MWIRGDGQPGRPPLVRKAGLAAVGEGSIYNATAFVTMPAWVVAMIGLGFVGLGNFLLGPPLKERKTTRQADAPAFQERMARHRAVVRSPEYQALNRRAKELSDAADRADEAGETTRRDSFERNGTRPFEPVALC